MNFEALAVALAFPLVVLIGIVVLNHIDEREAEKERKMASEAFNRHQEALRRRMTPPPE